MARRGESRHRGTTGEHFAYLWTTGSSCLSALLSIPLSSLFPLCLSAIDVPQTRSQHPRAAPKTRAFLARSRCLSTFFPHSSSPHHCSLSSSGYLATCKRQLQQRLFNMAKLFILIFDLRRRRKSSALRVKSRVGDANKVNCARFQITVAQGDNSNNSNINWLICNYLMWAALPTAQSAASNCRCAAAKVATAIRNAFPENLLSNLTDWRECNDVLMRWKSRSHQRFWWIDCKCGKAAMPETLAEVLVG